MTSDDIPEYLCQDAAVAARFARLKQRPVALSVRGLGKRFESGKGAVTAPEDSHWLTWMKPLRLR